MAKKTNKTNESFSVKDFKMWLLGLTEFQEAGWTPNAKQWKTILEKVELLDESVQYIQVTQAVETPNSMPQTATANAPQVVRQDNTLQVKAFDASTTIGGPGVQPSEQRFLEEPRKPVYNGTPAQTITDTGIVSIDISKPNSFV